MSDREGYGVLRHDSFQPAAASNVDAGVSPASTPPARRDIRVRSGAEARRMAGAARHTGVSGNPVHPPRAPTRPNGSPTGDITCAISPGGPPSRRDELAPPADGKRAQWPSPSPASSGIAPGSSRGNAAEMTRRRNNCRLRPAATMDGFVALIRDAAKRCGGVGFANPRRMSRRLGESSYRRPSSLASPVWDVLDCRVRPSGRERQG